MAKKKRKSTHRRRRRISGVANKGTLELIAGMAVGAVAARKVQDFIPGNGKVISGVQIVGGALVAQKAKGPFIKGIGLGAIGIGTVDLLHQVGVLKGVGEIDSDTVMIPMSGYEDEMSGLEDEMSGMVEDPISGMVEDPISGMWEDSVNGPDPVMVDDLDEQVVGLDY